MDIMDREHVNGLLRGAVGSIAGIAAMGLFFRATAKLSAASDGRDSQGEDGRGAESGQGAEHGRTGEDGQAGEAARDEGPIERIHALDDISAVGHAAREDENATEAVGRIAYDTMVGHDPDEATRQKLGQAVHWGYGILLGGVYGALRPEAELPDLTGGLGYGTAAWVLGDEVMVPLLGLSEGPTAHRWQEHATALGAHLVYGAVTAAATQALRRVM